MGTITLPSSEIAVGHCVILNDHEQPCGRMVVVIVEIEGDIVYCKYLCNDVDLSTYNRRRGMAASVSGKSHRLTPISAFGVNVRLDLQTRNYWCEKVAESSATYRDGRPRRWQEDEPIVRVARADVVAVMEGK